jgi:tetratricopeptide (TPR) repeat protein
LADAVDAIIETVLAAAPRGQQPAALCAKGEALVAVGDLDTALACFDRALRLDVAFAPAWVGRAIVLSDRKRDNEAFGCINRALDVDPRCAPALVHKGHILRGRGLHLEALAAYEAALGSGALEDARAGRAAMLRALGRTDSTAGAPAPAVPQTPIREKKKSGRKSGRFDPRAERKSFTSDPLIAKKSDPAMALGPEVMASRAPTNSPPANGPASSPPKRVSTRTPGSPSGGPPRLSQAAEDLAVLDEVRALCLANRHVEGLRKLEPIAKRCPSSREAWTLRGQVLFSIKQYDAALASVERVLRLEPKDQDALKLMVKVLGATNKDVRALETADRLLALAPRDAEVHRLRADCLVAAMRHVEAVVAYEKVIHYVPDDPSAWFALGRTLRQLRRAAEARMALTKAIALAQDKHATDLEAQARELLAKLPPGAG